MTLPSEAPALPSQEKTYLPLLLRSGYNSKVTTLITARDEHVITPSVIFDQPSPSALRGALLFIQMTSVTPVRGHFGLGAQRSTGVIFDGYDSG